MIAIALLALSGQGPEGAYIFKTDTPRPYQPFETLQPESLNVKLLGYVEDTTIFILDLAASEDGNYIYGVSEGSFIIYNISDPRTPQEVKRIDAGLCYAIEIIGNILLYSHWSHLVICSLKGDPLQPETMAVETLSGRIADITLADSVAFLSSGQIFAVSFINPYDPIILDSFPRGSKMNCYLDSLLFLLQTGYGDPSETTWVYILDVSDPTDIKEINRFWLPGGQMSCIAAWKDTFNLFSPTYGHIFLYVLGGIWADYIWDVTDPMNPELVWEGRTYGTEGIYLHSKFTYQTDILWVYDREIEPDGYYYVGYYKGLKAGGGKRPSWKKGMVLSGYDYPYYPGRLAIFQFSGDTVPTDTSDTTSHYIDWVRTVYGPPGLWFSLSKEANVSFSLYTATGAKAYQKDLGLLEPGPHMVGLPNLRPGIYVLLMKTNEESFRKNIVFTGGK